MAKLREMSDFETRVMAFAEEKTTTLPAGFVTPKTTRLGVKESKVYAPVLSIPNLPVIQPYNPTDGGIPVYSIAIKMPGFVSHIPAGIADLLAEHGVASDNLDIGLVVQNNTGNKALFRPNPWLHQDAPRAQVGYGVRSPNILVGTCSIGTSPTLFTPSQHSYTHQVRGSIAFSPNNLGIDRLAKDENNNLYSVIIDKDASPARAVVTLHVICSPALHAQMLSIGEKEEARTCSQIIDEMLSIDHVTSQPELTAALQTLKSGAPLPSHIYSGNTHSLQDTYHTSNVLHQQLEAKGFNITNIDEPNIHGMTALTYSVGKNNLGWIRACLVAGADPELENAHGKSALSMAKSTGDSKLIELLNSAIERKKSDKLYRFCKKYGFDYYDLEKENSHGVTPITVAASHNDIETLKILVERNVKIFKPNSHGNNALSIARRKDFLPIQEALITHSLLIIKEFAERYGFNENDLDAENTNRVTMLTVAVQKNMPEVVYALVENGANVELANSWGKTPISIAERGGFAELKSYLESKTGSAGPRASGAPRATI